MSLSSELLSNVVNQNMAVVGLETVKAGHELSLSLLMRSLSRPNKAGLGIIWECWCVSNHGFYQRSQFLADRTNGRTIGTLLRLSVCRPSSVTLCIVAKRCVVEQKLLLTAYRKSYMRNRLVPKWMTLTFI